MASACDDEHPATGSTAAPGGGATPVAPAPIRRWRAGLNYSYYWSDLRFSGVGDGSIEMHAVGASVEVRPVPAWTLQLGGGASLGGALTALDTRYAIQPGGLVALATSVRLLDGSGWTPFLMLSVSFAASFASTVDPVSNASTGLTALDARAGVVVGKTIANVFSPYLAARAFGGPIFWRARGQDQVGTDRYHFQLAAGFVVSIANRVDLFFEGAPFGERRIAAGGGFAF